MKIIKHTKIINQFFRRLKEMKKKDQLIKFFGNRGIILEEYDFRNE